ncbi:chorion peroxidase, partial [Elysia marginata]
KACFPIKVGAGDRFFNVPCLRARRSLGVKVDGVREQINGVTSFIDASMVYGPAKLLADELRTFEGGKLKTEKTTDGKGRLMHEDLPQLGVFKCRNKTINMDRCPHAGDPRANVFAGLTIMHTAFHMEHNRIAGKLAEQNPQWDDERLYQETRRILIATMQKITYTEYLPNLIGPHMMDVFGFNDPFTYDPDVDASVTNVFGADAFRFGHSQINGPLKITNQRSPGLSEIYFLPEVMLEENGGVMKVREWMTWRMD